MFGGKIRLIRIARGLSQEDVANNLKIEQSAYSKWENNKIKISDDQLEKLANFFGVTIEDIKSQEPILINFNQQSSNIGGIHHNNQVSYGINEDLLKSLQNQLSIKDSQINELLEIIKKQHNKI
jgi:transcriptional regulator with XRE-family HTH domain